MQHKYAQILKIMKHIESKSIQYTASYWYGKNIFVICKTDS